MFKNKSAWDYTKIKWIDQYMDGHKGFIAGGCFKNIFLNEKVKDLDIFFENSTDQIEAKMYFEKEEAYVQYYCNDKVDAFKNKYTGIVVELIKVVFGTPEHIISNFDFTITKFVYHRQNFDIINDEGLEDIDERLMVTFHEDFFEHLTQRRLVVDNDFLTKPANTFERLFKYGKYGFYPCRMTKIKMIRLLQGISEEGLGLSLYDGLD